MAAKHARRRELQGLHMVAVGPPPSDHIEGLEHPGHPGLELRAGLVAHHGEDARRCVGPGVRERGQEGRRALRGDAIEVVEDHDAILTGDRVEIAPQLLLIPVLRGVEHVHRGGDHRREVRRDQAATRSVRADEEGRTHGGTHHRITERRELEASAV